MKRAVVLAVALLLCLSVACGGHSSHTPASPAGARSSSDAGALATPNDDDALARSMLLALGDFPTGWAEKPSRTDSAGSGPFEACKSQSHFETNRTGDASTGEFSQGGSASISEAISVFSRSTDAERAIESVEPAMECFANKIDKGALDDATIAATEATFSPVSFPSLGEHSAAYRLQAHVTVKGETGLGSTADIYLDFVFIRQGRVTSLLVAEDILSPFDASELEQYARKAAGRLSGGAGAAGASERFDAGALNSFAEATVTQETGTHLFITRLADGRFIALYDLPPDQQELHANCRVVFKPDASLKTLSPLPGIEGAFVEACTAAETVWRADGTYDSGPGYGDLDVFDSTTTNGHLVVDLTSRACTRSRGVLGIPPFDVTRCGAPPR